MKYFGVYLLLFSAALCGAQIKKGASIYIEPIDGYETYLAAALLKKQVPLVVVTDKSKADYIIQSTVNHDVPLQPSTVVTNTTNVNTGQNDPFTEGMKLGARHAGVGESVTSSISVIDPKTSQVVFAYSVGKSRKNLLQSTAEACAKHLKEYIEKSEKSKK